MGKPKPSGDAPTRWSQRPRKQRIDQRTMRRYLFQGPRARGLRKRNMSNSGGGVQVAAAASVEEVEEVEVEVEVDSAAANEPVLPGTRVRATASHHTHTCRR